MDGSREWTKEKLPAVVAAASSVVVYLHRYHLKIRSILELLLCAMTTAMAESVVWWFVAIGTRRTIFGFETDEAVQPSLGSV